MITSRDELRKLRARAIWRHKPNCRGVVFEEHPFRDDCYREAEATMKAEEAAGLAIVPLEATEEMGDQAIAQLEKMLITSSINAAITTGNLLTKTGE